MNNSPTNENALIIPTVALDNHLSDGILRLEKADFALLLRNLITFNQFF